MFCEAKQQAMEPETAQKDFTTTLLSLAFTYCSKDDSPDIIAEIFCKPEEHLRILDLYTKNTKHEFTASDSNGNDLGKIKATSPTLHPQQGFILQFSLKGKPSKNSKWIRIKGSWPCEVGVNKKTFLPAVIDFSKQNTIFLDDWKLTYNLKRRETESLHINMSTSSSHTLPQLYDFTLAGRPDNKYPAHYPCALEFRDMNGKRIEYCEYRTNSSDKYEDGSRSDRFDIIFPFKPEKLEASFSVWEDKETIDIPIDILIPLSPSKVL